MELTTYEQISWL